MNSIAYTIISFIFCFILMIVYFSKDRINYVENKIYSFIVVTTFISCLVEIFSFCLVQAHIPADSLIYHITIKALFLGFLAWLYLFTLYTVVTGQKLRGTLKKKGFPFKKVSIIIILLSFVILGLPIEIKEVNGLLLPVGTSVALIYVLASLCILVMVISCIINRANLKNKKYVPIYLLVVFFAIVILVQNLFPELFLVNSAFVVITFAMYFTIENPDMKVVEELIENRKIIERSGEEKSVFLFKVSQGLREPVNEINKQIALYKEGTSKKETEAIMGTIQQNNQKIDYMINEILGINSFSQKAMKKVDNIYNVYSLLEDIKIRAKSYIKNDIDYSFTVVSTMPKELYGDSIKLKQVLMSILINAIENTSNGFVHVDVNAITRYDVCRVVISIEDSGSGIELKMINDILSQNLEIEDKEYLKIEKLDVDLRLAYKMIRALGGTMYIKSEVGHGTKVIITIDQYFMDSEESDMNSKIDSYVNARSSGKKVLIVNENEEEIQKIKSFLTRKGYDVSISMFGSDCIERVKKKERYDVILINDEMTLMSGISILKELKALKNASKKIVLLKEDKLFISKHYLKDGFDDFIDKRKLLDELGKKI